MLKLHRGRLIFALIAASSHIEATSRRSGQRVVGIVKRAQDGIASHTQASTASQIEPLAELDCARAEVTWI